ncbi:unnamed protein product, partial [marine sediment metagenome]
LELELAESERRREEEKQALEAKMAPVKVRVLRPFTEGIIDYTVDSVLEVRDVDWILKKISAGLVERVGIEVPVKIVPPPAAPPTPKHRYLTNEELDRLWMEFVAYGVSLRDMKEPAFYRERFLAEIRTAKDYVTASKRGIKLVDKILKEIRPLPDRVVPPPVPVAPPAVVAPAVEMLGPRTRTIETFTCWVPECSEQCALDRDLMKRVTIVPVLKAITPRGPRYEPLLRFPGRFYYTCEKHRYEKFGYRNIYDALAFLL